MKRFALGMLALLTFGSVAFAASGDPATLRPFSLAIDSGTKTATASSGAATLNKMSGKITSESLTTAAGAVYTLTITDSLVAATDQCFASVATGTNTTVGLEIGRVQPASGSLVATVWNRHASSALNGTVVVAFFCLKA